MGFYYESVKKSWSLEKIRPKDKVGTEFYDNWYYTKYIILSEIIPTSLGNKKKHRPTDKTFYVFPYYPGRDGIFHSHKCPFKYMATRSCMSP